MLCACGPAWDLDKPFALVLDIPESEYTATFNAQMVKASFTSAFTQLDARISSTAEQKIHVSYKQVCTCAQCGPNTVAVAKPHTDTLFFCPKVKENAQVYTDAGIKHELLHLLANRGDHVACETGAVISADLACEKQLGQYTAVDVAYLCESGLRGGVCTEKGR